MAFTDDDLERLEKSILNGKHIYGEIGQAVAFDLEMLIDRLRKAERLIDFIQHDSECVLSFFEAGEPTKNGGYRMKFKGIWYQAKPVDHTPKCNCGLTEACSEWQEAVGHAI